MNIPSHLFELLSGDRASNLQEAMHHYQEALRFYPTQTASSQHALMCANLGHIYLDLPTGDRASNLQKCIQYYQEALRFYTPKTEPLRYASIQSNLGNVYLALPTGERNNNLEIAQRYYQEALRFLTPQNDYVKYMMAQNNLGECYRRLPIGNRADNLAQAMKYYQEALRFCTPQSHALFMEVWLNTRARTARDSSPSLYAAIHPNAGTPLKFAESEGEAVACLFKDTLMDRTSAATKKNAIRGVREKTYIHFSCHGSYDWDDPLLSGLFLTDGTLTLAELQQGVIDLSQARLVTLSACENGQ